MPENISLEELQRPFRTESCVVHGISLRGISHEKSDMPLQDSFAAARLDNGWIVLAVADGVGSEPRAETGARIAAAAVVNHLRRFRGFRMDDQSVEKMLHAAYQAACAEIFAQAVQDQAPLRAYSTTLHTVIFSDGLVYIMHAGDGGVVMLTEEGQFRPVTVPMKGDDGESVVPLQGGPDSWQFSVCRERAQSVIVATDGILQKLCPPILTAYGDACGVEKSIAAFFASPWARPWQETTPEEIAERETLVFRGGMEEAIPEFYNTVVSAFAQGADAAEAQKLVIERVAPGNVPVKMLRGIMDDITLLTLVRFDPCPTPTPLDRISPPDWPAINRWASERMRVSEGSAPESRAEDTDQPASTEEEPSIDETEAEELDCDEDADT